MHFEPTPEQIALGDEKSIARAISWVENDHPKASELLKKLNGNSQIIGITGPPGAGKSTLVNSLVQYWAKENQKIAIIAVDPSSVFNFGSLLGDRLRMQSLFLLPNVFIRSLSSRGSLGGLSGSIIEVTEVLKHAGYQKIVIETVGVGQSEVEIAGLADTTIVVSVPESGDEIQTLKSGVMEIADIYVVNKADRDGSGTFASYLKQLAHVKATPDWEIPVVLTNAIENIGIAELSDFINSHSKFNHTNNRLISLLAEKCYTLIQKKRMATISIQQLESKIAFERELNTSFNLFKFLENY